MVVDHLRGPFDHLRRPILQHPLIEYHLRSVRTGRAHHRNVLEMVLEIVEVLRKFDPSIDFQCPSLIGPTN